MRFYDVNSGAILLDGINIKDFKREDLRKMFGMVLQDTWLFGGTIKDNIRYSKPDATDAEVIEAAKAAHVHHFIKTLPSSYDMILNEESSNVSAGQKQLLTIARAFLKDPKILILDEATNGLDPVVRTEILQILKDYIKDGEHSVLFSTHILSELDNIADYIYMILDGKCTLMGTNDELLDNFILITGSIQHQDFFKKKCLSFGV